MSRLFEELAWAPTPIGEISLRRRREPTTGADVFEVKLGDDFLMSSLFTVAEIALADLALDLLARHRHATPDGWNVVVGGLGLGHTAAAVLADERVGRLVVVEALAPVIDWHQRGLVPLGRELTGDPRCRFQLGDFFALSAGAGFDPASPGRRFDAILVDIDHSPRHPLAGGSADFYTVEGVRRLSERLSPDGVFGLWSNDPPDQAYVDVLRAVFDEVSAEVVTFPNPLQGREASNTIYLATGT